MKNKLRKNNRQNLGNVQKHKDKKLIEKSSLLYQTYTPKLFLTIFIYRTNQHSCAGPNNHCELVIQYMCSDNLRDGSTTR